VDDGWAALAPLNCLPTPAFNTVQPKPYTAHQAMFDPLYPHSRYYYWKSHKLGPLTDHIIDVVLEHAAKITSPLSAVPIFCLGGAVSRIPDAATAFPHRDAAHDIIIVASWLPADSGDAPRHIKWARDFFDALQPYGRGVYVNFTSDDANDRIRDAYTVQQWTRLTELKAKFDPTNFFRLNANIEPPTIN
jgi:hypothetical protein